MIDALGLARLRKIDEKHPPRLEADATNKLVTQKNALRDSPARLYAMQPHDSEELRATATRILEDKAEVDKLMSELDRRIAERSKNK